ncbi:cell envelope integrity protein TolA [Pseudomonas sp. RIT411]|uniref:cell envelope integrity protein TolA n=1 Tax=Pseudomonas sp. RIT411 TaxID=2202160 RepID=UPI00211457C8|nr:cell envelope integrity protein TolA [Pseudomonas sp. RIT 411]
MMRHRERSSSESYFWPVTWAVALHVLIFGLLFVSFAFTPELPQSRPVVQATLVQLKSKSSAQVQTEQKLAGEAKKTAAKQYEQEQLEQRRQQQEAQREAAAAKAAQQQKEAQQQAAEQKKADDARKAQQAEAAAKAAEAKAEAEKQSEAAKAAAEAKQAAEQKKQADIAKKKADEAAKQKAAEEAAKKAAAEAAKQKSAEEAKQKAAAEAAKKEAAAEAAKKKAADDAKKKAAQAAARKAAEDKKAQALAELLSDDTQRQQALAEEQGDEVASSFDDLIVRLVSEQWTRPQSARNGMSVEVQINMLPDGTITSATVTRSSGNKEFDNSAVSAVRNVGRIRELQQLDRKTFDQLYRQRRMIFKPEDLSL